VATVSGSACARPPRWGRPGEDDLFILAGVLALDLAEDGNATDRSDANRRNPAGDCRRKDCSLATPLSAVGLRHLCRASPSVGWPKRPTRLVVGVGVSGGAQPLNELAACGAWTRDDWGIGCSPSGSDDVTTPEIAS
jgi:hypothetical protein